MVATARRLETEADSEAFAAELLAANINPQTHLATDYLNHYNEITMLLEMLPDMPDMLDECLEWQPKSYQQHFEDSVFQAKDLAIEAYSLAPLNVRAAFEAVCDRLDKMILQVLNGLKLVGAAERGLTEQAASLVRMRISQMQEELMDLNKIIHGTWQESDTAADIFKEAEGEATVDDANSEAQTQADIDKLFD